MSDSIFDDWRNRYSQLFLSDGKWRILIHSDDGNVHSKRWRWWNPAHLVRMGLHWLWVRRYW